MAKTVKTVCIVLAILCVSAAAGLFAEHFSDRHIRASYPRSYSEYVEKYADEYGVPEPVCYAVIRTESSFRPAVVSSAGAIGLMQIQPATFTYLCETLGETHEVGLLYEPETNIRYGTYYLSMLYARFGDWETAFAAYNAGPNRVSGWISESGTDGKLENIPSEGVAEYVRRVGDARGKYAKLYYGGEQ